MPLIRSCLAVVVGGLLLAAWGYAAEPAAPEKPAPVVGEVAAGAALYAATCASCHGVDGRGDGPAAADMYLVPRDFGQAVFKFDTDADGTWGSDTDLRDVIRNGAAPYGGSPLMVGWPNLSDRHVADLIAFIRSLRR